MNKSLLLSSIDWIEVFSNDEEIQQVSDPRSYDQVEKHFIKVFNNVKDSDGVIVGDKIKFCEKYYNILLRCDINNSMSFIYTLLNKHIPADENTYFVDDAQILTDNFNEMVESNNSNNLPDDVKRILEFIYRLSDLKIPQEFVAGFLILMIKYVYNN